MLSELAADKTLSGMVLRLLATADEVCAGIGWAKQDQTFAAEQASFSFVRVPAADAKLSNLLPFRPHSLCQRVPPDAAIVLPKAMTPAVGCSVRALSHHLCLLPSKLTVLPTWYLNDNGSQGDQMRLLVIPFPFVVPGTSFVRGSSIDPFPSPREKTQGYFQLTQDWLDGLDPKVFADQMVIPLLREAKKKCGAQVHGVLFPECAFSKQFCDGVAMALANHPDELGLKFLIAGVMDNVPGREKRNAALCYAFDDRSPEKTVDPDVDSILLGAHSKHHPWCLDVSQIRRYGLSNLFQSTTDRWWEEIDVSERQLPFFAIRDDLCMTVLICEDLARADPAMPVVRAVGPNLVVALLMDGPQLASRWPGRYATVLADDPGSSVLSITCVGMVDRSNAHQKNPVRSVGLWRHADGDMQELVLPAGKCGLLLHLQSVAEEQFSLDHRGDGSETSRLELQYVDALGLGDSTPDWAFKQI